MRSKLLKRYIYPLVFGGFVTTTTLLLFFIIPDSIMSSPLEYVLGNLLSKVAPEFLEVQLPGSLPTFPIAKECTDFLAGTFVVLYFAFGTFSRKQRLVSVGVFLSINFLVNLLRLMATIFALETNYGLYTILHPTLYVVYFFVDIILLYYLIRSQRIHFPSSFTFFFTPPVNFSHPELSPRFTKSIAKRIFLVYLTSSASSLAIFMLFPSPPPPPPCSDQFIENPALSIDGNAALDVFCAGNGTDGLSWQTAHVIENIAIRRSGICFNFQNISKFLIIRGCTLQSFQNSCSRRHPLAYGIILSNCTRIKIENCLFIQFFTGIYLVNSEDITVSKNDVINSTDICYYNDQDNDYLRGYGIAVENTNNITISDNQILPVYFEESGSWYCDFMNRDSISLKKSNNTFLLNNKIQSIMAKMGNYNTLINNTATGIYILAGTQNILKNNTANLDIYGGGDNQLLDNTAFYLQIDSTCNNSVTNNNVINLRVDFAWNNTLENNLATQISLNYAGNNTLTNNTAKQFNLDWSSSNFLHTNNMPIFIDGNSSENEIDTTNVVGGKPIFYYENQIGLELAGQISVGQILLSNCNDSRIENNTISNNSAGIVVFRCNNNTFVNNSACNNPSNGISLFESNNNTLMNQTNCNNCGFGIYLEHSHNNSLLNSNTSNNGYGGTSNNGFYVGAHSVPDGICLESSNHNFLANLTSINNTGNGIKLSYSFDIMLANNSIDGNAMGVYISGSNNVSLIKNIMQGSGLETWDSHNLTIDMTNRINGKSIVYRENQTLGDISDSTPVGQIVLINCQNFQVANKNISLVSHAIVLEECQNVSIINVNASNNSEGIFLRDCLNITLFKNIVSFNQMNGINLQSSRNVNCSRNTVVNNGGVGISLVQSEDNWIEANNVSCNAQCGICSQYSDYIFVFYNNILANLQQGILLTDSDNFTISGNLITRNGESGIELQGSTCNLLSNNIISMHRGDLFPSESNYNIPVTGTAPILPPPSFYPVNSHCAILSYLSDSNNLTGNFAFNNEVGFHLVRSYSNFLEENTVVYNTNSGICLEFSNNNKILRNNLRQNGLSCILLLKGCTGNDIRDNECDEDQMLLVYIFGAIVGFGLCIIMIRFRQRHRRYRGAGSKLKLTKNL